MKRIICVIVILATVIALLPVFPAAEASRLYGDIDSDGKISVTDYVALKRHILGTATLSQSDMIYADVNGDGRVNSADYVAIRLHCLKIKPITQPSQEDIKMTVAYIPLDHRPVNVDRAVYLAAASGINLLMPETSLFANALDGQPKNSGGQLGDREALFAWLKSVEKDTDAFVISLDQMFSGGLVGSRWLDNTDLSFEYEIADYIISLTKTKKVYLFDTVMRLASTVGFGGYGTEEYSRLRSYAAVARKQLYGNDLTVDNIIAGYRYGEDGNVISTSLSNAALEKYFASRARKLKLADHIFRNSGSNMFCFIGVDDSSPQTTIQTNEIRYITSLIEEKNRLFAGADELGLMCLARLCTDTYGAPTVCTSFFGGGENEAADGFDIDSLSDSLQKHYDGLALASASAKDCDIRVLMLTRAYTGTVEQNAKELVKEYEKCIKDGKPVIIIDVTGKASVLGEALLASSAPLCNIIGYSSWNTAANATGIAISNGVGRYSFLKSGKEDTKLARDGFVRAIVFSLCKDIGYKCNSKSIVDNAIRSVGGDINNFYPMTNETTRNSINEAYRNAMLANNGFCVRVMSKLKNDGILTSDMKVTTFPSVRLTGFRLPWYRSFEATFDIVVG